MNKLAYLIPRLQAELYFLNAAKKTFLLTSRVNFYHAFAPLINN